MAIETRAVVTVRNPASGEVLAEVPEAGPALVREGVARARAAQQEWGKLSVRERAHQMTAFRKVLAREAEDLATRLARETGKPRQEALLTEVLPLVDLLAYFGRRAPRILRDHAIRLHFVLHRRSFLHYVPKGVVGVIAPWNFPLAIPMGETVMALVAGNAVVIKPSEITPLIALRAKELWEQAGLPADLFQVVTGRAATGQALIDSGIDHLSFTGSVAAGRKVGAACAERLLPCTLELGGKAPAIVCADADLERTAQALVWGSFVNSGQVCAAVERVYVMRPLYDRLVARVAELTRELRQGDPLGDNVDIGSMTFAPQRERTCEHLADAVAQGATIVAGGTPPQDGNGLFFPPTVLKDATPAMAAMREETFGPLLPLMAVDSEEEALRLANASHLGLNAYVFTRDVARGKRLARQIEAGTVMVNDVVATHACPETPWGGIKASGVGRVHSDIGLLDLVQVRHVNYPLIAVPRELWWFPYRGWTYRLAMAIIRRLFG